MDIERFKTLADAWGGDVARWPAADQAEARLLAERSEAARAALADAARLDMLLNAAASPALSPALADRVAALAPRPAAAPRWAAMAAALALTAGLGAGWFAGAGAEGAVEPLAEDGALYADAFGALSESELAFLEDA